jgi:hypothetical protein
MNGGGNGEWYDDKCMEAIKKRRMLQHNDTQIYKNKQNMINHYHTVHQLGCFHLKSAINERSQPGMLQPFKCSVHSCRGLEL